MKYHEHEIFRESVVILKKGAIIFSYNPRRKSYETVRRQRIKIAMIAEHSETIHWRGQGRYWCWTNMSNIEKVEAI